MTKHCLNISEFSVGDTFEIPEGIYKLADVKDLVLEKGSLRPLSGCSKCDGDENLCLKLLWFCRNSPTYYFTKIEDDT